MSPLSPDDLRAAHTIIAQWGQGETMDQIRMDALRAEWEPKVHPPLKGRTEAFDVALADGSVTGVTGPRWIFHLFGIRHRAAEVAFRTPAGLIILQRRSPTKDEWPNAIDMTVSGHIPHQPGKNSLSYEQGAWKEIEEEIGLPEEEAPHVLQEGKLVTIGTPYCCFEADWRRNPPFMDSEVRQVFAGTLTGEGLAKLRFTDNEVSGLLLVTVPTAWQILREETIASGLRYSLPRYLDWLDQQNLHTPPMHDRS